MSKRDFTHIFERIAAAHNTTVENVKREIEAAARDGFNHPDPKVQEQWVKIPRKKNRNTRRIDCLPCQVRLYHCCEMCIVDRNFGKCYYGKNIQRNSKATENSWGKSAPRRQFLARGRSFRFCTGTHQFGASFGFDERS